MSTPHDQSWQTIPRARRAPAGVRGADAATWGMRAATALLIVAAGLFVFTLVRPLPGGAPPSAVEIPEPREIRADAVDMQARRERLALLGTDNAFDARRENWTVPTAPDGPSSAGAGSTGAAGSTAPPIPVPGTSIVVTHRDALPNDVKEALAGLALRGVYVSPRREAVAMISRVHSGPNPLKSEPFRIGDSFTDDKYPQAEWKVVEIDVPGGSVILGRGGVNAALQMYPAGGAATFASSASSPAVAAQGDEALPQIVSRTADEAAADLRTAGVAEDLVRRLLRLASMPPEEVRAFKELEAIEQASANAAADAARVKAATDPKNRKKRPPPPGLEAIARMLRETPGDGQEAPTAAPPAPPTTPSTDQAPSRADPR
ncbi:MAG: hypothetical protein SFZ24_07370 [Planctomycetota bacterium]|nr:hypothetical protein [Planctomycetota bacterium]